MDHMTDADSSAAPTGPADLSDDRGAAHEVRAIDEVVERLADRFPAASTDRIREVVDSVHQEFEESAIRDFVPVFVERGAKDILADEPKAD